MQYEILPTVDATQEFIEIANDFSNPLDIVREAISNSFDAEATSIDIKFDVQDVYSNSVLAIRLYDNGKGMNKEELQAFFDLGNSTKRNDKKHNIGEKGHGTKVYFNSAQICVTSVCNKVKYEAVMDEPFKSLYDRQIPIVNVIETDTNEGNYTLITIKGYNSNRLEKFTHEILKDYILWFTKFGSIERGLGIDKFNDVTLRLKGLNRDKYEILEFGHFFPEDSKSVQKLFDEKITRAPDYYCKRFIKRGHLKNNPHMSFEAIFCVEGNRIKHGYNEMIRRPGYSAPEGAYTVQDRYGLWISKDYIPIQRKNEWLSFKGYEFTKFHAFINCQNLNLTANRGSVENTPSGILEDLELEVKKIYEHISTSNDYRDLEWLEDEAAAYRTTTKEKKDFEWRIKKANRLNTALYKDTTLVQPERESGVYTIAIQLLTLNKEIFPFQIVDYDTHTGIDVIVKSEKNSPINQTKLFYLEFKYILKNNFNHSFENLHSIICWDTDIKHDDYITDINNEERKLQIVNPVNNSDYKKYFLDNPTKAHKIEVYVLKDYLKDKLNIEFRPRDKDAIS